MVGLDLVGLLMILLCNPPDQHRLHFLSHLEAARCGYTIQIDHVGDLVLRASFLACHVHIEVASGLYMSHCFPATTFSIHSADWHWLSPQPLACEAADGGEGGSVPLTSPLLRSREQLEQQRDCLWGKIHGGEWLKLDYLVQENYGTKQIYICSVFNL